MEDFSKRRKQIRYQQRLKVLGRLWQFIGVSGLTGLSMWWALGQEWHIRNTEQIQILGIRHIPLESLKLNVPLVYPQSIFQIEPQKIADHLQRVAPINQVLVARSVLPARLKIEITERVPVAIAKRQGRVGFLDRDGVWLPQSSYPSAVPKPNLTVMEPEGASIPFWVSLYQQLLDSPIAIRQIDARDLQNLVLVTELGVIHSGTYRPELFPKQLQTIAQLKTLPQKINDRAIIYYDVRDPNSPIVQTSPKNAGTQQASQ